MKFIRQVCLLDDNTPQLRVYVNGDFNSTPPTNTIEVYLFDGEEKGPQIMIEDKENHWTHGRFEKIRKEIYSYVCEKAGEKEPPFDFYLDLASANAENTISRKA